MWILNTNDSILDIMTRSICHFVFAKKRGGQGEVGRVVDANYFAKKSQLSYLC